MVRESNVVLELEKVMFFSPLGEKPKVSSIERVSGKPKILKRAQSTIEWSLDDRIFISSKDSWLNRSSGRIECVERK